jgi:drug/metabolite transporter (DMT)-like permease
MPLSHSRAVLALLGAAALFSTGGAAIKAVDFDGWQIASLRAGIAAVTLVLLSRDARRGWGARTLLVGGAYAVTCIMFVLATRLTTSANAIFIQSASPLFVLLLSPLLLGERARPSDAAFMLPIAAGLALVFLGNEERIVTAPDPARGNLFAAVSGVGFAFAVIGFRWLGREAAGGAAPITAVVAGNVMAFLAALPAALPIGRHAPGTWILLLYLGTVQIGLAYWLVVRALGRLGALEASLILLLEPVLNPVWSWMAHGETPGPFAIMGGVLVLGGTLGRAWWSERRAGAEKRAIRMRENGSTDLTETLSPH